MTYLQGAHTTPMPWLNVIANPGFGFQVSVEGAGYTWSSNSREDQLTAWSNDPVIDPSGEVIYIQDEDSGAFWTPTALPIRQPRAIYCARHGQGYSRFDHTSNGLELQLVQFVPFDDTIKISRLLIRNQSSRRRHVAVIAYTEWFLGPPSATKASSIITSIDSATGAMFARNSFRVDFGARTSFADLRGRQTSWTGDRCEFLGRFGSSAEPAALRSARPLSCNVGAALDPCAVLRTAVVLEPGESVELAIFLGDAPSH